MKKLFIFIGGFIWCEMIYSQLPNCRFAIDKCKRFSSGVNCEKAGSMVRLYVYFLPENPPSKNIVQAHFKLINCSSDTIYRSSKLLVGFLNDISADYIFEIQTEDSSGRYFTRETPDYSSVLSDLPPPLPIPPGDSLNYDFDVSMFYVWDFPVGNHRLKVRYVLSKHNSNMTDIISDWIYFKIRKQSPNSQL